MVGGVVGRLEGPGTNLTVLDRQHDVPPIVEGPRAPCDSTLDPALTTTRTGCVSVCTCVPVSPPPEGIKLLQEGGVPDVDPYGDLNTELERTLGRIVKEKYGTDFYILHRYPMAVSEAGQRTQPSCGSIGHGSADWGQWRGMQGEQQAANVQFAVAQQVKQWVAFRRPLMLLSVLCHAVLCCGVCCAVLCCADSAILHHALR